MSRSIASSAWPRRFFSGVSPAWTGASARWDGARLEFLPGLRREDVPAKDAHDELWRVYYHSIFNPARLKVRIMQSEMPRKFWANLPEARLIPDLIATSETRTRRMITTAPRAPKPRGKG